MSTHSFEVFMYVAIGILSALILFGLLYMVLGKRYTDKIVATNIIGSIGINVIVLLSILLEADYILDIAIVFAILSFLEVIVLCRIVQNHVLGDMKKNMEEDAESEESL